jgi:hypothetical protein
MVRALFPVWALSGGPHVSYANLGTAQAFSVIEFSIRFIQRLVDFANFLRRKSDGHELSNPTLNRQPVLARANFPA